MTQPSGRRGAGFGEYPKRRATSRPRPWVPEVPDVFELPDVSDMSAVPETAGAVAAVPAATVTVDPSGETVVASTSDGTVEVKVDLRGHLCHLRIDPSVLRSPHPQRVGGAVVEAMSEARAVANGLFNERRRR